MARTEGLCICEADGCECPTKTNAGWVDKITGKCRQCEMDHGDRWGHHGAKAIEPTQEPGERNL